jgi:hypothetical protein
MAQLSCRKFVVLLVLAISGLSFHAPAEAVPIVEAGVLRGAHDVLVGADLYNVEFVTGTCGSLFSGCDDPADFAFADYTAASLASQALLDQVFLDLDGFFFDSMPSMTAGCERDGRGQAAKCNVQTGYTRDLGDSRSLRMVNLENTGPSHIDFDGMTGPLFGQVISASTDTAPIPNATWARWTRAATSVPEPGTATLFAFACLALLAARRFARPR